MERIRRFTKENPWMLLGLAGIVLLIGISLFYNRQHNAAGAGSDPKNSPTPISKETGANALVSQAAEPQEPTEPPVSPTPTTDPHQGMVRSTLTNEWMEESMAGRRPIAVMLNNVKVAVPQTGISHAGIVYECMVEGNVTRLMAVIEDYEGLAKIGSVRSCRAYYVYWALEWDALYLHYGGPVKYVSELLKRSDVHNLDGTYLEGLTFYRTSDRKAPHNAYGSGEGVVLGADKRGYPLTHTERFVERHFRFAPDGEPNLLSEGILAKRVEPGYSYNQPWFAYNEEDGLYYRYQYGQPQIDDMTGEQLAYKNVIFQFAESKTLDHNGYLSFTTKASNMDGYYITNGRAIPVTWSKTGDFEPTRFYDADGNEIVLNTGKTWICVIQNSKRGNVVLE